MEKKEKEKEKEKEEGRNIVLLPSIIIVFKNCLSCV